MYIMSHAGHGIACSVCSGCGQIACMAENDDALIRAGIHWRLCSEVVLAELG